jgi:hypothetical protein
MAMPARKKAALKTVAEPAATKKSTTRAKRKSDPDIDDFDESIAKKSKTKSEETDEDFEEPGEKAPKKNKAHRSSDGLLSHLHMSAATQKT